MDTYPQEVQEQFYDFLHNVPFIRWMVSEDRPEVWELERDSEGKAIIDVTKPPLLSNTDYSVISFKYVSIFSFKSGKSFSIVAHTWSGFIV